MDEDKFNELQFFLESQASQAWWKTQRNPNAFSTVADTLGHNLETQLQTHNEELGRILSNLGKKSIDEALGEIQEDSIDFSNYIRPSSQAGYKEVYVGQKWVLVPESTCVEFVETEVTMPNGGVNQGFKVTLYEEGTSNWSQFEHSHTMADVEQLLLATEGQAVDVSLQPAQFQNSSTGMWEDYGRPGLNWSQRQMGFADDFINSTGAIAGDAFLRQPGKVRRSYSYKVTKQLKKIGVNPKAGKVHKKMMDFAKLGRNGKLGSLTKITKPLGPLANVLTAGVVVDEVISDTWDAHTVVDGTLLVVGVIAAGAGAPIVLAGIAVYGILDYFFDIGEGLDATIGRDSGLWDESVQEAPIDREVLFQKAVKDFEKNSPWQHQEVKIDNTRVKKPLLIKPPFKD